MPLTDAQRLEVRARLEELRREIERSLGGATEEARPVDLELSIGRLSRVDALQQQHLAMARRRRDETRMQHVVSALSRLETEAFGTCVRCEEPIAFERLRVRPETLLCLDCQKAEPAG